MAIAKATIHGAISIVNAIATGKGAALGISKKVNVEMETSYAVSYTHLTLPTILLV